jgi:hypothetical protein
MNDGRQQDARVKLSMTVKQGGAPGDSIPGSRDTYEVGP